MTDLLKAVYGTLNQLMNGLAFPILMIVPITLSLRLASSAINCLCRGGRTVYIQGRSEQIRSEPIRADPPTVSLKKNEIDSDLEKYFNYNVDR